jgi:succinyl-diaminopimelate desuccinylase
MKTQLTQYFRNNMERITEEILSLLAEMIRHRTVNVVPEQLPLHPYLQFRGEEFRVADIVKRELERAGIPVQEHARIEGRPNIIGTVGCNEGGSRLLVASHMDIVPPGDGWDTDPFEMTRKEGLVYGRGVLDNKGPLAASVVAAGILKKLGGDQLKGQFQIAALCDEEAHDPDGTDYGIGFLLENDLLATDMAIIPDIGENMKQIDVAEKGTNFIKITATGKQAHGSTPERGVNAVYAMARLIREIESLVLRHEPHPVLGLPSLNLGQINGGVAPNVVPGDCQIMLDIRSIPGMSTAGIIAELQALCDKAGGVFRIDVVNSAQPHAINPDHQLVKVIQSNCEQGLGFLPTPFGMGGATFAKTLNLRGIPAVGWGPGDDAAFHMVNEYVEIRQLFDFAMMLCLVAVDLCQS